MKNLKINYLIKLLVLAMVYFINIKCTRDLSADAPLSKNSNLAEVFTDSPIGMGTNFYFPYAAGPDNAVGSKLDAWTVDQTVSYKGNASMRFDVPTDTDPNGNYAGGIFRIDGAGRDLSGYDALTFWAKASQGVTIGEIGFGEDFYPNKYITTMTNISLGTNWTKIIIPIPDASKLINEKGMLRYAAGTQGTNGKGYIFWIDELKFEKLGTIANPKPSIFNGDNSSSQTINGALISLENLKVSFNMASGINQSVNISPSFLNFTSSNNSVATIDGLGIIKVLKAGTSIIKASLAGVQALGSLTINSIGDLPSAPIPTQSQSNVKSIFCDTYTPETNINYAPGFGGSNTKTSLSTVNNNSFLLYSNNNYTGIIFKNTVDASSLSFMHVDVFALQAGSQVEFQIRDVGANGVLNTNVNNGQPIDDDKDFRYTSPTLTVNGWNSINIPLSGNIANQKNNLKAIILVGGPNFILDNVYFYSAQTAPTIAAPTPTLASANVISVFSDAYINIAGSNLNPNWNQTTLVTQTPIAGNNTLKYSNFNYQGLQLGTAQNVSSMTTLHIDYYTSNSTSLNAYLISTGPIEKSMALTVPTSGSWTSLEIPLSNFSPVNLSDVIQLKFDGNGTVYLDNIYFHN